MSNYNELHIVGHVTRDPELKYSQAGTAFAKFGVAVNDWKKAEDGTTEVDFFDVTVFRQKAEFVAQYLKKGAEVTVKGAFRSRKFTGEDGVARTFWTLEAQTVLIHGLKADREGQEGAEGSGPVTGRREVDARPVKKMRETVPSKAPAPVDEDTDESDPFADE